ncbi:hypothetical protein [Prauserella shujinwangii]|nr:hypothetical protein [Prauserella shujinwangii]
MDASKVIPRHRLFVALLASCLVLVLGSAAAAASPGAVTGPKKDLKVHAAVDKKVVKVNEKVKLRGALEVRSQGKGRADASGGLEPVIVQSLQAGAWVNLTTSSCRPNGKFFLNLSFSFSANLTLRVYHPETHVYASAYSELVTLAVI